MKCLMIDAVSKIKHDSVKERWEEGLLQIRWTGASFCRGNISNGTWGASHAGTGGEHKRAKQWGQGGIWSLLTWSKQVPSPLSFSSSSLARCPSLGQTPCPGLLSDSKVHHASDINYETLKLKNVSDVDFMASDGNCHLPALNLSHHKLPVHLLYHKEHPESTSHGAAC